MGVRCGKIKMNEDNLIELRFKVDKDHSLKEIMGIMRYSSIKDDYLYWQLEKLILRKLKEFINSFDLISNETERSNVLRNFKTLFGEDI